MTDLRKREEVESGRGSNARPDRDLPRARVGPLPRNKTSMPTRTARAIRIPAAAPDGGRCLVPGARDRGAGDGGGGAARVAPVALGRRPRAVGVDPGTHAEKDEPPDDHGNENAPGAFQAFHRLV